jgi:ABC-2 type transport system permease protein
MSELAGTKQLLGLILRRDRWVLPIWVLLPPALALVYASSISALYPTTESRQALAASVAASPAELALIGPVFGSSTGDLTAWRSAYVLVIVALAAALTVIRHTRAEEEAGRLELVGAAVVGRYANLTAATAAAAAGSVVGGCLVALGLLSLGLAPVGCLALGASTAASGCIFASVAAVAAQLSSSARAARGLALGALGVCVLLRAVGDADSLAWLSWLSPIGWLQRMRPFADERWEPIALALLAVACLMATAFALSSRRDVGTGLLASRPAAASASRGLRGPLSLAWRLQRATLLAWTLGFAVIGSVVGSSAAEASGQLGDSAQIHRVLVRIGGRGDLVDAYLAAAMGILGFLAAGYAVSATVLMRAEEISGRAEQALAAAVSRLRWVLSHLLFAGVGAAVALSVGGVAAGLSYGRTDGQVWLQLRRLVGAALVQLPAAWLVAGVSFALFGLVPRVSVSASWSILALSLLIGELGEAFRLNPILLGLSPFDHIPKLPSAPMSATGPTCLVVIAGLLAATGYVGVRSRDSR